MASDAQPKKNKHIPAILMGTLVFVVFASTMLFWAAVKGHIDLPAMLGTKNNGVLIRPPRAIADLPLQLSDGQSFDFAKQPKHWSIVIPVHAHCDERCQQTLYLTRQIHIALGKYADRVQRYLVTTELPLDSNFENLLKQHPKVEILHVDAAAFDKYFASMGLQPLENRQYFILDPEGWLMMYYGPQNEDKAMLKDLKFLLTNSHEDEGRN
ncbi:MAG TPA: hypothetical protein VFM32_02995 [Spongiibacteraceae bacterium]|nr:hypothetical protein [Spongiibacteraceae bacterium]